MNPEVHQPAAAIIIFSLAQTSGVLIGANFRTNAEAGLLLPSARFYWTARQPIIVMDQWKCGGFRSKHQYYLEVS